VETPDVAAQWNEAAPYWEKHRGVIERMFAPVTEALVADAGLASGQAVLDVATGPGEPALHVAGVVGARGRVVGVDVVPAMIAAARREQARRGLAHASFQVASAEELPLEDASFDAILCRFGVMFFPAPLEGLREMRRVLRPGGRLALAAWGRAGENPFHAVLAEILERVAPSPPPAPDAPEAFRFAEPGKLLALARAAGLARARERRLDFSIAAPLTLDAFWTVRTEMSDTLRRKLAALAPAQVDGIRRDFLAAARPFAGPEGLSFPARVVVVSGMRPEAG
jgi:SAM-dependent methyltransferase